MVEDDSMPTVAIFILYALTCFSITGIISCTVRDHRKKKIDALHPVPEIEYRKKLKTGPTVRG